MKTIVQVFEQGQAETMSHNERRLAVEKALHHHATQLQELSGLMAAIFERDNEGHDKEVDSDFFLPFLRVMLKERYQIIDHLEDEYNRVIDSNFDRPSAVPKETPGTRNLATAARKAPRRKAA